MSCEEDQIRVDVGNSSVSEISDSRTLLIEDIISLKTEGNLESSMEVISSADLDYDPHDILNSFLESEDKDSEM
jgi:hypothetical protein